MIAHDVKAVLFDLDGTLIDSAPDLGAAADQMRIARGLPSLPYERYRPMAGAGARGMLGVAFGITPDHADFPALREEFFRNYEACMTQRTYVFEGVKQLIDSLVERDVPWGVVTNKSMRFTGPLTKGMPLFASARAVVGGDSTPYSKPHPAPLLEAARQVGVKPIECLYVGDDVRDVQAGKAAGMGTVAATYGYLGATDVKDWGADVHIETPLALLPLLKFRVAA
ncbi:HAD-IA family hydrolase [Ramlibacter ginsenosidimutans]|uniref:HAD-IA family hydrolase n=2 Tax=Ramlibacter ginsenosidimutans TaxID=502333 RepID=A0A934TSF2_9BURK|nr:HAD-IA family hydrolase [Ramlibacter ginsenosidimutans]